MLSQAFRNPNVELAAAGLFTVGIGFLYLLLGISWFLNGKPLVVVGTASVLGLLMQITGVGVLNRSSWIRRIFGYVVSIGLVYFLPRKGLSQLGIFLSLPMIIGAALYVLLAREEFASTQRPQEVKRPFYNYRD